MGGAGRWVGQAVCIIRLFNDSLTGSRLGLRDRETIIG